jgi:hypothetical protein
VDPLDPFSEGIIFSVRPPKKSWKNISNLSGGEKTLSSLALVFALHHYKPTPLYVMDEIDAALDFKNVAIVANYIKVFILPTILTVIKTSVYSPSRTQSRRIIFFRLVRRPSIGRCQLPSSHASEHSPVEWAMQERTKNAQFIIISLRNNMFELADRLVGIYKVRGVPRWLGPIWLFTL